MYSADVTFVIYNITLNLTSLLTFVHASSLLCPCDIYQREIWNNVN